jgi:hypothetical protein
VLLQLPLVRLPWRYELVPLTEGERTVAARLLAGLQTDDLVLLDQGFWSYGLFHQIAEQGAYFGIRRYPHVRLHPLRQLGPQDTLVRWDQPTGPRWRGRGLPAQLHLRVIDYQIPGFRPSAVVTNVLDPQQVSRAEWVRLATDTPAGAERLGQGLYHRRWEIETTFRELKVEQGLQGGLRGRTEECIRYEVAGHMLLYLLVRWLLVEAAAAAGLDPLALSFKHALEAVKEMHVVLLAASAEEVSTRLLPRLYERLREHRVPFRAGRHYPRPKDKQRKRRRKAARASQRTQKKAG